MKQQQQQNVGLILNLCTNGFIRSNSCLLTGSIFEENVSVTVKSEEQRLDY